MTRGGLMALVMLSNGCWCTVLYTRARYNENKVKITQNAKNKCRERAQQKNAL